MGFCKMELFNEDELQKIVDFYNDEKERRFYCRRNDIFCKNAENCEFMEKGFYGG